MKYQHSHLIDPSSYDNQCLCDGIPLRCHRNSDIEEFGLMRLRNDWQKHIGSLPSTTYGGQGPQYNFTAVTIPECLPERLEIVAYIMEFAFLHDDLVDQAEASEGLGFFEKMMKEIKAGFRSTDRRQGSSGESRILGDIFEEMMAVDSPRAKQFLEYWKRGVSLPRDRTRFESLDDYLDFRLVDSGAFLLSGLITFGMGLTIPPSEIDECSRLTRPAWAAAFLTNDVQSWEKECEEYKNQIKWNHTADAPHMVNGVWILMRQYSINVQEAIDRVFQKVKVFVAEFVDTVRTVHDRKDLSEDSRCFIEAVQHMVSGNLIWGISSPRYHPDRSLNELQVARVKHTGPLHIPPVIKDTKHPPAPPDEDIKVVDGSKEIEESAHHITRVDSHSGPSPNDPIPQSLGVFLTQGLPTPSSLPISSPSSYINALPSKNIRDKAADALNVWLNVPQADLSHIKRIVNMLHNASLMLDDMEDGSTLRRGSPAAHTIFGIAQTMNSAGWQVVEATREIQKLNDDSSIEMCMEELSNMYIGQGHDIFWATNVVCPSLDEYLKMVDYKTGGLFRILTRLMLAKSPTPPWSDLTAIASLMGRYFQVRDDYMNLSSADYTKKKGFCEDLDEGKFSLLMIHTMQAAPEVDRMLLQNLLAQRRAAGKMSMAQKHLILEIMKKTGSMEYVAKVLEALLAEVRKMVDDVDKECGIENEMMRSLLGSLGVEAPLL
nr:Bifunctional terpene synthase [Didymosphaeria variabile]